MTVYELQTKLDELEEAIEALQTEQKRYPGQLVRAIAAADGAEIERISQVRAEMPGRLFVAEVEKLRCAMNLADAQEVERLAEIATLQEVAKPLQAQIAAIKAELLPTLDRLALLARNERRYRDKRLSAKLRLDRLTEQRQIELGAGGAPFVRALNYA